MRSLSTKLLVAIAPTLAALAILSGPASAARPSDCPGHMSLGSSVVTPNWDSNLDGLVCEMTNPAGKLIAHRDRPH